METSVIMDTFKSLTMAGAIAKLYEGTPFKACTTPFFETGKGYATTSSCSFLEGVDFDLTFFPFKHLGYKAVLCTTGELYAVMSTPQTLNVVIGVSAKLDFAEVSLIWEGIVLAGKEFGYKEVGLQLVPSLTGLSISVCATGWEEHSIATARPIASTMDLVCISGNPGASFLGSQLLSRDAAKTETSSAEGLGKYRQLVGAHLKPELSPDTLTALKEAKIVPSFGYFCRESLASIVHRLATDSGLGVKLYVDKIPFAGGSIDASKELELDPVQAALRGGDDCYLLFTIPIGKHETFRHDFQQWDVIGHLARPEVGTVLVSPDGLEHSF